MAIISRRGNEARCINSVLLYRNSVPMHGSTVYSLTDPNVSVGLPQGGLPELVGAEDVKKTHVEVVEVWFDGGSLHDQILCHPGIVFLPNQAAEFLHLGSERRRRRKEEERRGEEKGKRRKGEGKGEGRWRREGGGGKVEGGRRREGGGGKEEGGEEKTKEEKGIVQASLVHRPFESK